MPRTMLASVLSICVVVWVQAASAQFIDWDSGGFNNSWQNTANWNATPPRIPNAVDVVGIGTLAAAHDDTVVLDDDAVGGTLVVLGGADVDTNGNSLTIGFASSFSGADDTPSELIVRSTGNIGGLGYAVSTNSIGFADGSQLRMVGGRLEVHGNASADGRLTIADQATLVGYGVISLQESDELLDDLFDSAGQVIVGEPEQIVLGVPPARTLVIEAPNTEDFFPLDFSDGGSGQLQIERNSTLEISSPDDLGITGGTVVLEGNSTLDLGVTHMQLNPGASLIVNSGAVEGGIIPLPAVPAVIEGSNYFTLFGATLSVNESDEELIFRTHFRHSGGIVNNEGIIRLEEGAVISSTATFITTGNGQIINEISSELNFSNNADVDSPVLNHGMISIQSGDEGNATVDTLTLSDTSTLRIDVRSVIPGQFDALTVEGNAILEGTLAVVFNPTYVPVLGNSFTILTTTFGAISGTFDTAIVPTTPGGLTIDVLYPDNQTVLLEVVEALVGDYNDDGSVDAADYVVWQENEGTANLLPNDPIGGMIGSAHYDQWRAHFGASGVGAASSAAATIPEPSAIGMSCLALLAVLPLSLQHKFAPARH